MITRYASVAGFSLALAAAVALFGAVTAGAQTTNTNGNTGNPGYDLLNAQSANPTSGTGSYSANTNATTDTNANTGATGTTNSMMNASSATGTGAGAAGSAGTTNVNRTTNANTPGVPNTGAGGNAPINLAVLIISGLIVAAGMTYVTLRLAL